IEYVVVKRILLLNRTTPFEDAMADLAPLSHDSYLLPRGNVEDVIDRVGLRARGLTKERYLGKQPILLLVAFAQPVECAGDTLRGDQVVRVNFSDILDLRN